MGPAAQGTMTGWQMFVGALARMVGPMWASALFTIDTRAHYVFGLTAGLCLVAAAILIVWWKRFIPWQDPNQDESSAGKRMFSPVDHEKAALLNGDH